MVFPRHAVTPKILFLDATDSELVARYKETRRSHPLAADGRVVAAVHAGRRGLLGGILSEAVAALRARTDGPIEALIGPAICGSCYEVPEQMASESESSMPGIRTRTSWGTPSLDLPAAAAASLSALGVRVVTDPRCTLEDQALFSYRRDSGCGRQALVIVPV